VVKLSALRRVTGVDAGATSAEGGSAVARDTTSQRPFRELAQRTNCDIEVTLLWSAFDDRLAVTVSDSRSGAWFVLDADVNNALDVYYHPFAHTTSHARIGEPAFEARRTIRDGFVTTEYVAKEPK
jgi:hypothetical protein